MHSDFDVGLLKAKMIGFSLLAAISLIMFSVKPPGTAATPKIKIIIIIIIITNLFTLCGSTS